MPEPPVRFSTMNGCLSDSCSLAAKRRASGSTEPPGGYGETNFTTCVGHSCAPAAVAAAAKASTAKSFLKGDIPSSFEFEHLARIVRRGHAEAELLEDAPRLAHLLGVRFRELAAAEPQAVFE